MMYSRCQIFLLLSWFQCSLQSFQHKGYRTALRNWSRYFRSSAKWTCRTIRNRTLYLEPLMSNSPSSPWWCLSLRWKIWSWRHYQRNNQIFGTQWNPEKAQHFTESAVFRKFSTQGHQDAKCLLHGRVKLHSPVQRRKWPSDSRIHAAAFSL